jgi:16S rRNA (cytosine1402-N4)-methyltransferase
MRMDRRQVLSGWDVVNTSDEPELARIIREYGEEREARRIARMIIRARPLDTTGQLAAAVGSAVGSRFLTKVLARVFQAIRIRVNDELGSLRDVLADAPSLLAAGGRIVVISYHSLEDRIVKSCFRDASAGRAPSGHKLIPDTILKPTLRVLTKSPVTPTAEEVRKNPRARSAKMRVAERLPV